MSKVIVCDVCGVSKEECIEQEEFLFEVGKSYRINIEEKFYSEIVIKGNKPNYTHICFSCMQSIFLANTTDVKGIKQ